MKKDSIELLSESLITENPMLAVEALAVSSKCSIPLGWHYLLDIIWVLKNIENNESDINKKDVSILEVGAGGGVLQFILASYGYKVISADIAPRIITENIKLMYQVEEVQDESFLSNEYIKHHNMTKPSVWQRFTNRLFQTSLSSLSRALRKSYVIKGEKLGESRTDSQPKIMLYQADAQNMPSIKNSQVDYCVSISALEHNKPEIATKIQKELIRVTKNNGLILHTVSAQYEGRGFHEPSYSFLMGEKELSETYLLNEFTSNFEEWEALFQSLKDSKYLSRWLASMYYNKEKSGMPLGVWSPSYMPTGVKKYVTK